MTQASFAAEQDLHFVLCDFGPSGQAYVETDPSEADASTIVRNLLQGQYNRPVRVLALNVEEGWVRDVSQLIAAKVQDVARRDGQELTVGTRGFIETHMVLSEGRGRLEFSGRQTETDTMNLLLLLVVAVPLSCLAFLSWLALLGVVALGAVINMIGIARASRPKWLRFEPANSSVG